MVWTWWFSMIWKCVDLSQILKNKTIKACYVKWLKDEMINKNNRVNLLYINDILGYYFMDCTVQDKQKIIPFSVFCEKMFNASMHNIFFQLISHSSSSVL